MTNRNFDDNSLKCILKYTYFESFNMIIFNFPHLQNMFLTWETVEDYCLRKFSKAWQPYIIYMDWNVNAQAELEKKN